MINYNLNKRLNPFLIAEIGNNHEGSFRVAKKLILEAAKAGVDAVKFQHIVPEKFTSLKEKKRFKLLKKFFLDKKKLSKLAKFAKKKKLFFICTPFDLESVTYLNKIVDCFKISSGDNNYYELIDKVLSFKKDVIISTGFLNNRELLRLIKFIKKKYSLKKVFFLHCVSDYPVEDKEANLLSIKYLKEKYNINVGYSDHTIGVEASIIATAYGAKIIEKHFTINKNFSSFRDHQLSADPKEMKNLVHSVNRVSNMLGKYDKFVSKNEKKNIRSMRRSLYFNQDINKNEKILKEKIKIVRPFVNLKPNDISSVIFKKVRKFQKEDKPLDLKNMF